MIKISIYYAILVISGGFLSISELPVIVHHLYGIAERSYLWVYSCNHDKLSSVDG